MIVIKRDGRKQEFDFQKVVDVIHNTYDAINQEVPDKFIEQGSVDELISDCGYNADNVYDSIALLGYTCALAANDFHHIHLCAEGDKFQEIHESADNYLADVREFGDICLELAKEGNIELMNETYALDILKDNGGSDWQVADKASYNFNSPICRFII